MTNRIAVALALLTLLPLPAAAVEAHHEGGAKAAASPAQLADGEVRKVDKDAKKLTIRHGQIPSLNMPPMTMVFQVKDPAMLDQVKAGDRIRFSAENLGGALTVTQMEPAK